MSTSLTPYSGSWEKSHAVHLLNRTVFGASKTVVDSFTSIGMQASIDKLFEEKELPGPPVYYNFNDDPNVPNGETWVYTPITQGIQGLNNARKRSLRAWQTGLFQLTTDHIAEKMWLFWHEHLPIAAVGNAQIEYQYVDVIKRNTLGNFKTMIEEITVSPAMLLFLNGNDNTAANPNENYARELLELFTIGRGLEAGDGDYTNYTEQDVAEIARALTGWRSRFVDNSPLPQGLYITNRHDKEPKQLSHRFDNVIIDNLEEEEYKRVIEIIFEKTETAKHLCRKLHIWFVGSDINEEVEENIISPMADIMINDNYDISNALKALLQSEYFYDSGINGCMINSPIDYTMKILNGFEVQFPNSVEFSYRIWRTISQSLAANQMAILELPSVAGWKAYYQAPVYYEFWINSVTLNLRDQLASILMNGYNVGDNRVGIDPLAFIAKLDDALDPNALIRESAEILLAVPITQDQINYLKDLLIPGLPDFEWTVEYADHLEHPEDVNLANSVRAKLVSMFGALIRMPEFYLM